MINLKKIVAITLILVCTLSCKKQMIDLPWHFQVNDGSEIISHAASDYDPIYQSDNATIDVRPSYLTSSNGDTTAIANTIVFKTSELSVNQWISVHLSLIIIDSTFIKNILNTQDRSERYRLFQQLFNNNVFKSTSYKYMFNAEFINRKGESLYTKLIGSPLMDDNYIKIMQVQKMSETTERQFFAISFEYRFTAYKQQLLPNGSIGYIQPIIINGNGYCKYKL